ncbi:MAG: ABC transporter permease [Bacillota bacterium]|nr:ABC transporter permease [Bacillota bacterium]
MTFKRVTILFAISIVLIYGGLILSLYSFFSTEHLLNMIRSPRILYSIRLSIAAASITVFFSMILAVPAAFALSRYNFAGKRIVDTLLELPLFVSPAALGAMILIFFNTPAGVWVQGNIQQFVFTVYGIVLAQIIAVLGISVRLVKAVFDEIPLRYEAVARTLGASPFRAFSTVTLPNAYKGLFAATVLTWAKAVGEFGATVTVAGTIAMRTETLPVSIYMRLASADIEGAVGSIIVLITISLLVLYFSRLLFSGGGYVRS